MTWDIKREYDLYYERPIVLKQFVFCFVKTAVYPRNGFNQLNGVLKSIENSNMATIDSVN